MKILFKDIAKEIVLNLSSAKSNIKVAVAWFTNEDLFNKLCSKLQEGVTVELLIINDLINNNEYNGLDFQRFIDMGGNFYFGDPDNLMHHKFCIIDNQILINGSYNWTYYAEYKNLENVTIYNNSNEIQPFNNEFNRILKELSPIKKITKNTDTSSLNYDLTSKNILSDDIFLKASKYESAGDYANALNLTKKAMGLNPKPSYKTQYDNLSLKQNEILNAASTVINNKRTPFNNSPKLEVKSTKKETSVNLPKLKMNIRALDPNNVVPAGFLKNGTYRLDFNASSKFEERTAKGSGKIYKVIACEFTDSQYNTIKGNISEYQLPALMREGKIILGEGMVIEVTREQGSTFADITLINLGMPVIELQFDEKAK